jgi:hypothetical protein
VAEDAAAWVSTNMPGYAATLDNPVEFHSMHYLAAGAMLYGEKGYEYDGNTYAGEHIHASVGCLKCHMADDPVSSDVGGHTFHVAHGDTQATTYCKGCHPDMTTLDDPWNAGAPTVATAISAMLDSLEAAVLAFDHPADGNTAADIVSSYGRYPYKAATDQAWSPPAAAAAFNLYYVKKEPGAYAHNYSYAVQLLYDSYQDLLLEHNSGAPPLPPAMTSVSRP